jgi:hypothetical protein
MKELWASFLHFRDKIGMQTRKENHFEVSIQLLLHLNQTAIIHPI